MMNKKNDMYNIPGKNASLEQSEICPCTVLVRTGLNLSKSTHCSIGCMILMLRLTEPVFEVLGKRYNKIIMVV